MRPAVARLRAAGAVILGKTQTTQFAFKDPAPTRNPWSARAHPGRVVVGIRRPRSRPGRCPARSAPRPCGSILRPAAYCGVVGLKGAYGASRSTASCRSRGRSTTAGPFARSVADAALVWRRARRAPGARRPAPSRSTGRGWRRAASCSTVPSRRSGAISRTSIARLRGRRRGSSRGRAADRRSRGRRARPDGSSSRRGRGGARGDVRGPRRRVRPGHRRARPRGPGGHRPDEARRGRTRARRVPRRPSARCWRPSTRCSRRSRPAPAPALGRRHRRLLAVCAVELHRRAVDLDPDRARRRRASRSPSSSSAGPPGRLERLLGGGGLVRAGPRIRGGAVLGRRAGLSASPRRPASRPGRLSRQRAAPWRRGALADDQFGRELDARLRRRLAVGHAQHELGGGHRHVHERLADRRQRRTDPARDRQVVEADDAQVLRDVQSHLARGLVDAERLEVVAREDRRRPVAAAAGGRGPSRCPRSTWNWPWLTSARIDRHAGLVHRRAIPVEPGPAAQDPLGSADDADAAMPEAEQVPGRGQAAVPVRRADRWRVVERFAGRVDDDEGDPARRAAGRARLATGRRRPRSRRSAVGRGRPRSSRDPASAGPASPRARPRGGAGRRRARRRGRSRAPTRSRARGR